MEFRRFATDGGEVLVNMDLIQKIEPSGEHFALNGPDGKLVLTVTREQLDELVASMDGKEDALPLKSLLPMIGRLTAAVERLSAHIPSSLRVHW